MTSYSVKGTHHSMVASAQVTDHARCSAQILIILHENLAEYTLRFRICCHYCAWQAAATKPHYKELTLH